MVTEHISIVIVENQPLMRAALGKTFASEDISVLALLAGGMEAVSAAPKLNPNVILLALGSPGWAEMEMIPTLRKSMPTSLIVALVTGEIPGQEATALDRGADLALSKATPRSDLLKAVRELSRKRINPAAVQVD